MYEVVVPPGVRPNQSFSILANGQRVLVTCPPNVRPGMKVRFQLPKLEGVNKPELLPSEPELNVIQVEKFLTKGQEKRMDDLLTKLEKDTGWRVRVLCQAYPRTPG